MLHFKLKRAIAGAAGVLIASTSFVGIASTFATSSATVAPGYVEICKTFTPPPANLNINLNATFSFTVQNGWTSIPVSVAAGTCSQPIAVSVSPTGSTPVTITETQAAWFKVTNIAEQPGQTYINYNSTSPNFATGSVSVNVSASAAIDTVTYTNAAVTGYVEVCKSAVPGSGLTGTYAFTVSGADGFSNSTTAAAVGIGNCSDPIQVPAGTVTVSEAGTNLYVTGVSALTNGVGASQIVGTPNLSSGVVNAKVAASADTSTQTDVTFTNDVVAFKICKTWDGSTTEPGGSATTFPFSLATAGPAGPNTLPAAVSLAAGQCSIPAMLRPGTAVTVTEGIVPGTKVENISAVGAESMPSAPSLTARTTTVIVGTPVTSMSNPANEAVVTFQDEAAGTGTLKVCSTPGTVVPIGTSATFTVTGAPGTTTVGYGLCAFVDGADGVPMLFPFNSTVTITQAASADNATTAIITSPTYVTEMVAGVPTLTSETVLSGTATLGGTNTTSSVSVVIGEGTMTEASFYLADPPASPTQVVTASPTQVATASPTQVATASPTQVVTVAIPGGSNLGVVSGLGSGIATSVATFAPVTASANSVANTNFIATAASFKKLSSSQLRAIGRADRSMLKSVNKRISAERNVIRHAHGNSRRAALRTLASLRARQHVLQLEIRLL